MNNSAKELWFEYMVEGICGLCGNTGKMPEIYTVTSNGRPLTLPRGVSCICPNGRILKRHIMKEEKLRNAAPLNK